MLCCARQVAGAVVSGAAGCLRTSRGHQGLLRPGKVGMRQVSVSRIAMVSNSGANVDGEVAQPKSPHIGRLDLRVGHINQVQRHENADTLYVQQVVVGEAEPRTIVSGLVPFLDSHQLQDRSVVVCCNMKPKKMRGVVSHGMLLCAFIADDEGKTIRVEPIQPGMAQPGTRIAAPGFESDFDKNLNSKRKEFEQIQPDFAVANGVVTYRGIPLQVDGQPVTVSSDFDGGQVA
eukprot:m.261930 g.261930  ORF g.261930 m.261930 type:complete len:232 (-) comp15583_c1_seq2:285-980(-)